MKIREEHTALAVLFLSFYPELIAQPYKRLSIYEHRTATMENTIGWKFTAWLKAIFNTTDVFYGYGGSGYGAKLRSEGDHSK